MIAVSAVIFALVYFLPTVACPARIRKDVFTLNLCLGWTGIIWVMLLFWAFTSDRSPAVTSKREVNP
jgi:hypothetical protein